jgi:hypothetical protein
LFARGDVKMTLQSFSCQQTTPYGAVLPTKMPGFPPKGMVWTVLNKLPYKILT